MATGTKFQNFVNDLLVARTINLNTDTFGMLLTNTLPIATQHLYPTNFVGELANGNGYTTGGFALTGAAVSYAAGVVSFSVPQVILTATGGSVGPWRYFAYYDITTGTLMAWDDYGASTTLTVGQQVPFSQAGGILFTDS